MDRGHIERTSLLISEWHESGVCVRAQGKILQQINLGSSMRGYAEVVVGDVVTRCGGKAPQTS